MNKKLLHLETDGQVVIRRIRQYVPIGENDCDALSIACHILRTEMRTRILVNALKISGKGNYTFS